MARAVLATDRLPQSWRRSACLPGNECQGVRSTDHIAELRLNLPSPCSQCRAKLATSTELPGACDWTCTAECSVSAPPPPTVARVVRPIRPSVVRSDPRNLVGRCVGWLSSGLACHAGAMAMLTVVPLGCRGHRFGESRQRVCCQRGFSCRLVLRSHLVCLTCAVCVAILACESIALKGCTFQAPPWRASSCPLGRRGGSIGRTSTWLWSSMSSQCHRLGTSPARSPASGSACPLQAQAGGKSTSITDLAMSVAKGSKRCGARRS